ncbi:MAG: hypothetical protein AB7F23_06790 [Phycisphaerae bacterium]
MFWAQFAKLNEMRIIQDFLYLAIMNMRITERELAGIKPYENNPRLNYNEVEAVADR